MSLLTKGLIVVILALLVAVGVQTWRVSAGKHDAVEAAVAPAKEQAAASKAEERKAAATLDARIDTVTRWLTRTVHDTVPVAALHPVTPADTAAAVAELPKVEARYQGCRLQLTEAKDDCATYKFRAEKRAVDDSLVIVKQDALLRDRPPKRSWHVGITGGYGALLNGGHVLTGPAVSAGITWTPF
jgi:hypothetical protein